MGITVGTTVTTDIIGITTDIMGRGSIWGAECIPITPRIMSLTTATRMVTRTTATAATGYCLTSGSGCKGVAKAGGPLRFPFDRRT